jgi:hypothetical protein
MAKTAEDRPPSAEVALRLWRILGGLGVRLPEPSYN